MTDDQRFRNDRAIGFLLAQVGAHAAGRFAERLAPLGLKPPDAGILRMLGQSPGISQQELASRLNMHASRLVALVDDLETLGLVERQAKAEDRRTHALHLTSKGSSTLGVIGQIAREHNEDLCSALGREEREAFGKLLLRIAEQQGLSAGVHPGYRRLPVGDRKPQGAERRK
jgi:DNA-binding MarR family transcriptional regulator